MPLLSANTLTAWLSCFGVCRGRRLFSVFHLQDFLFLRRGGRLLATQGYIGSLALFFTDVQDGPPVLPFLSY
jgi:hypothetical protein